MASELTPVEARAQDPSFLADCSLEGLRSRLPLPWPAPPDTPPSPKNAYRSHYVYLGWEELEDPAFWEHASDFDLLLRLVDFSPLRPVLAQLLGWTSARGQTPFDPLSFFLLIGWQITQRWHRSQVLRALRDPRYADYARLFGFHDHDYPTEGGLRHFLTALGQHSPAQETVLLDGERIARQRLNQLLVQSVILIREAGFVTPQAWQQALICPDGMLHQAASRLRCRAVADSCYLPTSPASPRPCPAKEKGRQGCDCDTPACAQICRQATPRDPEARYVWYQGSNQHPDPNQSLDQNGQKPSRGKGLYGYRSLPLQLADPIRRFSLILLDDFQPANRREETPVAALLLQLSNCYPSLDVDAVAGDAGFGYDIVLHTIHHDLHARRLVDLRAHPTDRDQNLWVLRGYDDHGRPICPFGYALCANGFDPARRRHKWTCRQACQRGKQPLVTLPDAQYPPAQCPHATSDRPHGLIVNVGERFADGSIRLARDLPVGTPEWKRLYHRGRNAVEGRNSTFEAWGLKRLSAYGLARGRATNFLADAWSNLSTMARLAREATLAKDGT
ncbi:MAG: hypothetical protein ABIH46_04380 [Chloroflexota bacterium]